MKLTLGIDEAGRGPAIGPMVMAAVCLNTRAARSLSRRGVRDSKLFGAGAIEHRRDMAQLIRAHATHVELRVVAVDVIDERVRKRELNALEREVARELIACSPTSHRIVADGKTLFQSLAEIYPNLEAHDKGESKHCAVAAASIVAKDRRDAIFAAIAERYRDDFGPIAGGGYTNAATRRFLRDYARRFGCLPPEARRSWPHHYLSDLLGG